MALNEEDKKSVFSRISSQFQTVPCSRTAFMYGLLGGFGAGLTSFLMTSRVKRSSDIGVGVFTMTTLLTFGYCRYTRAKLRMVQRRYEELQGIEPTEVSYGPAGGLK
ncbi:cytochrome c oxidase assembly protein COX20, mitochondrial-like [Patiria miniata]|uniref:Cytochrome c oxidase assembly protein COX20, mitochondrial n=1 Tax=Patiria miniata TaxID=46514 RepID=A0A914BDX9_PATMI|nr:cytochrome c oxidase assembly protein COX20, mitochondrial-like [Patiria miniata]